jgi:hypothetical protein
MLHTGILKYIKEDVKQQFFSDIVLVILQRRINVYPTFYEIMVDKRKQRESQSINTDEVGKDNSFSKKEVITQ